MNKIGLGLIGLGYVGKTHLRSCSKLKSAKLVAVADISKGALRLARRMGVEKTFEDYHELLRDEHVHAVIIALPTHLHAICAKEAAEAGKDIFLEKPLARSVTEGEQIVSKAEKYGVKLMVGYPLRFVPSFRGLKKRISLGLLGDVPFAHAVMVSQGPFFHRGEGNIPHPVPSWWFKREMVGGGSLIDQGCHLINLLQWYLGGVVDVECHLGYRFHLDVEDHAICLLRFSHDQTAIVNVGWYSMKNQVKVELLGSIDHAIAYHESSNRIVAAIQLLAGITPDFEKPYVAELQHFVDQIKLQQSPSPSGKEALEDLEVISLAYKKGLF